MQFFTKKTVKLSIYIYIYFHLCLEYTVYYINFKFTFTGVNNDGVRC